MINPTLFLLPQDIKCSVFPIPRSRARNWRGTAHLFTTLPFIVYHPSHFTVVSVYLINNGVGLVVCIDVRIDAFR